MVSEEIRKRFDAASDDSRAESVTLTPDQLKALAALADRWLVADARDRALLQVNAREQGGVFARAFDAMVAQLESHTSGETSLPSLEPGVRDAALAVMSQPVPTDGLHPLSERVSV